MNIDDYVGICVGTSIVMVAIAFVIIAIRMWKD